MGEVKVKKVRPYPIPAQIIGTPPLQAEILKLAKSGLIADMKTHLLKVGDHYTVQFEIPVSRHNITTAIRVVKTYDRLLPGSSEVQHLCEFHFEKLGDSDWKYIYSFLKAIRQTDID